MTNPPKLLVELQDWFSQGLLESEHTESIKTNKEISQYITDSEELSPKERYDIYVRDYWPRCIQSLKDDFLCLAYFWDKKKFKRKITEYLRSHPSRSFTLFHLGQDMVTYFDKNYHDEDRELIINSIKYNWAEMKAGFSKLKDPLDPQKIKEEDLPNKILLKQDHVTLLEIPYTYHAWEKKNYNKEFLKEEKTYLCISQHNGKRKIDEITKSSYDIIESIIENKTIQKGIEELKVIVTTDQVHTALQVALKLKIFCQPK